ncbi:MAG: ATP-dependent sacrificial sulfur transferase LarE [Oscillospiraceae bacterium]|nr:ATP-dependent sacrificial sulfur transferase LarE [Oscillospiraceae bacterium]
MDKNLNGKLNSLKEYIKSLGSIAVAFSGGVDSTFLLKIAHEVLGENAAAVTVRSDLQPEREYAGSEDFIRREKIRHYIIEFNDYDLSCFKENPPDRCYFCKKEIFSKIFDLAESKGVAYIADGSNLGDLNDYRPGARAVKEMGVKSPLLEAGLTKEDIRTLSKDIGIYSWDKQSSACMASRFPYGTPVTRENLDKVIKAEKYLFDSGFKQFRVRFHGDVARIEVSDEEIHRFFDFDFMKEVAEKIKEAGFLYAGLDLEGFKSGSLNRVLDYDNKK